MGKYRETSERRRPWLKELSPGALVSRAAESVGGKSAESRAGEWGFVKGVVDVVVVCGAIPEVCEKHPAKEKVACAVHDISIQVSPGSSTDITYLPSIITYILFKFPFQLAIT